MNLKMLITTAAAAAALSTATHADVFQFSFTSVPGTLPPPNTNFVIVPGSVTGRIYGLSDNGDDQQATDVVITAYASGIQGLPPVVFSLFDYADFLRIHNDPNIDISQNDFSVHDGVVTAAIFQIFGGYFDMNVAPGIAGPGTAVDSLVSPDNLTRVQNLGAFDAITFQAVPEPATWGLMLLGFGGLGAVLRARRKPAFAAA